MNENELWEQSVYDEAWAKVDREEPLHWVELERAEWEHYRVRSKVWRAIIIVWILASVGILAVTVLVKLHNAMVGQ